MLSVFPQDVLGEISELIETVSDGFPIYSLVLEYYLDYSNNDLGLTLFSYNKQRKMLILLLISSTI